ncbi:hypothetical protein Tco_0195142 [Tanacetum coccineum]
MFRPLQAYGLGDMPNLVRRMAEPLSLDHVFDFPADDLAHDFVDSYMKFEEVPEEEPEEDPEEEPEEDPEEVIPPVVASPPKSPITPPPLSESSSDSEFTAAPVTSNETLWVPPPGSTFETRQTKSVVTRTGVDRIRRRMDTFDVDLGFIERDAIGTSDDVLALQEGSARDQDVITGNFSELQYC